MLREHGDSRLCLTEASLLLTFSAGETRCAAERLSPVTGRNVSAGEQVMLRELWRMPIGNQVDKR